MTESLLKVRHFPNNVSLNPCKISVRNAFLKMCYFYIRIQLINNVVLVLGVQQSDSVICLPVLFFKFFSQLGCYGILCRVSCAIQRVLAGYPF